MVSYMFFKKRVVYVSNPTLHTDRHVPFVNDLARKKYIKFNKKTNFSSQPICTSIILPHHSRQFSSASYEGVAKRSVTMTVK